MKEEEAEDEEVDEVDGVDGVDTAIISGSCFPSPALLFFVFLRVFESSW